MNARRISKEAERFAKYYDDKQIWRCGKCERTHNTKKQANDCCQITETE